MEETNATRAGQAIAASHGGVGTLLFLVAMAVGAQVRPPFDLVISGGRVMDPESGLDGVRDVAIRDGSIASISEDDLEGREELDARGLVVAPGFIDLHAHGQDPTSNRYQAADGVTTALEMEIGVFPVADWYASREGEALIHYGATVGHLPARIKLMHGVDAGHTPTMPPEVREALGDTAYAHRPATDEEIAELLELMNEGLDEGGLGFGLGITYTPAASHREILRVFELAARRRAPVYVHLRAASAFSDEEVIGAFQEVIADAAVTGAGLHIVHLNSTADERARLCLEMIRGARRRGIDVTTESYPYTAGSTRIESALFDGWEEGGRFDNLQWVETGEFLTRETFEKYRQQGGWVIIHGRSEETNTWIVSQPDVMVASDGIPFLGGRAHPRGAGTFARVLGHYAREKEALSLMDALRKMTLLPARRVEGIAPRMARKGRVAEGADADLTLFDPDRVLDRATYEDPDRVSAGIVHVLVGGTFVVRDAELVDGVAPGQAIRGRGRGE